MTRERRPFSLCMPYHNNPSMLSRHYLTLSCLPQRLKDGIELIVCDDASDPAERAHYPHGDIGLPVHIFRIPPPHVPWSHRLASNIAASEAHGMFFLMTDIDHIVPEKTWSYLMAERTPMLRTDRAYVFTRENIDGSIYRPHPDSWLFHCSVWQQIGGYDERYRGHYGQNYAFIQRVQHNTTIEGLPVPLIRVSRDDIPDASERVLTRKSEEAKAAVANLRRQFVLDGTFYADTRCSVPYERVYP